MWGNVGLAECVYVRYRSKMAHSTQAVRIRSTREEHTARMREAERRLISGQHPAVVERFLVEEHGVCHRQARRYIRAVRSVYKAHAAEDLLSQDEMLRTLLVRADAAVDGAEPDHKASIKALELYARLRGWLDRKSTLTVQGSITVAAMPALQGASEEEIAALAAFHDARSRRLASEQTVDVVGSLGALPDTGIPREPTRATIIDVVPADGEPSDGR